MKKLLSALAAIGLSVTTVGAAVACKSPKNEDSRPDLSKLSDNLTISSITKSATEFKNKLLAKIKETDDFKNIKDDSITLKVEVTKDGKKVYEEITNENVPSFDTYKVKLEASEKATDIKGSKEVNVTWTDARLDLNTISTKTLDVRSLKDVSDFKDKVLVQIKAKLPEANNVTVDDLVFKTSTGAALTKQFITGTEINIKLAGKANSSKVIEKDVDLKINWTDAKVNLATIDKNLTVTSSKYVEDFKAKVLEQLNAKTSGIKLASTDINITKEDGGQLVHTYITGDSIKIKISASSDDNVKVTGEDVFTVAWTSGKLDLSTTETKTINVTSTKEIDSFNTEVLRALHALYLGVVMQQTDINITKEDGSAIKSDDIANNLKIKVTGTQASRTVNTNPAVFTVNWTDGRLDLTSLDLTGISITSLKEKTDYEAKLLKAINDKSITIKFVASDIVIKKTGGNADLQDSDIVSGLQVTVSGAPASTKVKSTSANITVTWIDGRKDITDLSEELTVTSKATLEDFKDKLVAQIKLQTGFEDFNVSDIDKLEKEVRGKTSALVVGDLNSKTIDVKITVKSTSHKFKNATTITVNLTVTK